jgi:sirohydrochlorin ferrochelatase
MQNMPPLIGLAHGSRDPRAARMIGEVMQAVQALRPGLVAVPAFLDLSEPDLTGAVAALREDLSIAEAIVLPLLFSEAYHATIDAPTAVRDAQEATGVSLRLGGILGMGEDVLMALEDSAAAAHIASHEAILLLAVGSSNDDANAAVHDLADRWSRRRLGPVWAGFATTGEPQAAACLERATRERRRVGVVPLFLAPGLLLDATARAAMDIDAEVAEPLGTALAGLVLRRYDEALTPART